VLHELGAHVVRVTDPRRPDPFPLRDELRVGQQVSPLDLGIPSERDAFAVLLERAELLVDGTTPRVLGNIGLADAPLPIVRIAAFAGDDRPGYGLAAEARGGWAARHDPPRLGRSSVADPIAGLLAVMLAVDVLTGGTRTARARVSLEEAVGHLLAVERRDG
jgi:crotonobetainyl-CoA:carnitine CoA-transferase CaiB-like acyl-CoA transferase